MGGQLLLPGRGPARLDSRSHLPTCKIELRSPINFLPRIGKIRSGNDALEYVANRGQANDEDIAQASGWLR